MLVFVVLSPVIFSSAPGSIPHVWQTRPTSIYTVFEARFSCLYLAFEAESGPINCKMAFIRHGTRLGAYNSHNYFIMIHSPLDPKFYLVINLLLGDKQVTSAFNQH